MRFQVGASISRAIASRRTRATTNSPSMPAAASAGSGRTQTGGVAAPSVYRLEAAFFCMAHNIPPPMARGHDVKASVFIATSLDGFIARANGELDWLPADGVEEHGYEAFIATVDALVIGRKTYETVLGFDT